MTAIRKVVALTALISTAALAAPPPPRPAPRLEITEWRYRDGVDPPAMATGFDDTKWEAIKDPATGRGPGGLSYGWYRTQLQVPEKLGDLSITGKPLQLSILADEYAEIWLDGEFKFQFDPAQPPNAPKNRSLGYEIAGFNKANLVSLGVRKPGDKITIAVLVINGPIARPIGKYSIRYARLEFAPSPPK